MSKQAVVGILAHVDAGKTTLAEAMLFDAGRIRKRGRVDDGDSHLDTNEIERERGITIFSSQAVLDHGDTHVMLVDAPGHVDFSAEAERTLRALDYAILVVGANDGVQGHTETLWRLLARYDIPTFIYINKIDLENPGRDVLLAQLGQRLSEGCLDANELLAGGAVQEDAAALDEAALEEFLEAGELSVATLSRMVAERKLFPCFAGSALKDQGVDELLDGICALMRERTWPQEFAARVYRVSRGDRGERLAWVKVTGGVLRAKQVVEGCSGASTWEQKIDQVRIYNGEKYELAQEVAAGGICAVTGLAHVRPGDALGAEPAGDAPVIAPVLTYTVLPGEHDVHAVFKALTELADEDPMLGVSWNTHLEQIHLQLMGAVQLEVVQRVREVNAMRRQRAPGRQFSGKSCFAPELRRDPSLELDYIVAKPQMARYIDVSARVYQIYLGYVAPEDIHVYSIDEVFIDATAYLKTYGLTARELARRMIADVLRQTGVTATAGIGTNLYLCKIAMDIEAKHILPDRDGVRIAELDEMSYRRQLWAHRPLTDFWRVGRGYAKKLEAIGIYTMGDIAKCSIGKPSEYYNEELLYQMFGINAELLIDHAWGWEPCRMADIKAYRPETNSISSGQVLQCPYPYDKARLVVREMAEAVALELLEKQLVTDQLTLTVGYDIENTAGGNFRGEIVTDRYGRKIPKHAHGTANLPRKTSSARSIMDAVLSIYDEKVNPKLSVRRITITANKIVSEDDVPQEAEAPVQFNLFDDIAAQEQQHKDEETKLERERKIQEAMLGIKKKFGKNAILNGGSYLDGATARERNGQIGGHKA